MIIIKKQCGQNKDSSPKYFEYIYCNYEYIYDMKRIKEEKLTLFQIQQIFEKYGIKNPFDKSKIYECLIAAEVGYSCNIGTRGPDLLNTENILIDDNIILNENEGKFVSCKTLGNEKNSTIQWHWLSEHSTSNENKINELIISVRNGCNVWNEIYSITGKELENIKNLVNSKSTNTSEINSKGKGHLSLTKKQIMKFGAVRK